MKISAPPDRTYVPDHPYWFVDVAKPYPERNYIQGVAYTETVWGNNGIRAFTDTSLARCSPFVLGNSANCRNIITGFLQEDVIYVPDSTYEAETEIPNPSCRARTGIRLIDFYIGCFTAYYATGNWESGYIDTTFGDDFDLYSATVGLYQAGSLLSSSSYFNYIYFDAERETLESMAYKIVKIRGQVGSRIPSYCRSPLCVWGVDTSKVLESAPLLPN